MIGHELSNNNESPIITKPKKFRELNKAKIRLRLLILKFPYSFCAQYVIIRKQSNQNRCQRHYPSLVVYYIYHLDQINKCEYGQII
jgi:hypothetical protein